MLDFDRTSISVPVIKHYHYFPFICFSVSEVEEKEKSSISNHLDVLCVDWDCVTLFCVDGVHEMHETFLVANI